MYKHAIAYGIGAAGVGVLGLIFGDFALNWQPVPEGIPGRIPLAYVNAIILIVAGALVLTRTYAIAGAYTLALLYSLYAIVLHGPGVIAAPLEIGAWLGCAETFALASGGLMLALVLEGRHRVAWMRATQFVFGLCAIVFGLSHFGYPDFTASMIPEWIPGRLFWAYATGVGHIAAGTAIAAGALAAGAADSNARLALVLVTLSRLAAVMLTAMLALFILLVHVTGVAGVAGDPASRVEWTMLFVATSLAGAAWVIGAALTQAAASSATLRTLSSSQT